MVPLLSTTGSLLRGSRKSAKHSRFSEAALTPMYPLLLSVEERETTLSGSSSAEFGIHAPTPNGSTTMCCPQPKNDVIVRKPDTRGQSSQNVRLHRHYVQPPKYLYIQTCLQFDSLSRFLPPPSTYSAFPRVAAAVPFGVATFGADALPG